VTRYGPLAAATALLLGAAIETGSNDYPSTLSVALLTSGFMVLGGWLAIESYHLWKGQEKDDEVGGDDDSN
jgi:hypothetical protein